MLRFILTGLLGFLIQQVSKKGNRRDPMMSFKQLADETFAEAWEDWEFTQGFYCGLSQEAKEHIDALAGGTFFMLNVEEA
jgi:hypothetical protein